MPRDLEDVLHFFLPGPEAGDDVAAEPVPRDGPQPLALPILTVPVAPRDAVRAAFAWNLAVEIARLGARASLVAPLDDEAAPLWPEPGAGPLGARVRYARAGDASGLAQAATDEAIAAAAGASEEGGVVVVCVPPSWLLRGDAARPLLRWLALFVTPEPRDLQECYALAKGAWRRSTSPLVGVIVHGVRRMRDAERAFARVATVASRHLGRAPVSYGLLADDLHVYRAIASRRPIGLEHPQSRAARALRDVAGMLHEDARKRTLV